MKKILLAIELSERAEKIVDYALQFAAFTKAELLILHVVSPQYNAPGSPVVTFQSTEIKVNSTKKHLNRMINLRKKALELEEVENLRIIDLIEIGSATSQITQVGKREEVDLIMLGTRGESRTRLDVLMGSVAAGVVKNADRSVLVIPEDAVYKSISIVAYATDLLTADAFEIWKAVQFLEPFLPIVEVVHVDMKNEDYEKTTDRMEEMKALFSEDSPGMQIRFHQLKGKNLVDQLNDFSVAQNADLLVMYKPFSSFWDQLFHQSQTKKMALYTWVPLLVFKEQE